LFSRVLFSRVSDEMVLYLQKEELRKKAAHRKVSPSGVWHRRLRLLR
jgi:hypothetical protein